MFHDKGAKFTALKLFSTKYLGSVNENWCFKETATTLSLCGNDLKFLLSNMLRNQEEKKSSFKVKP